MLLEYFNEHENARIAAAVSLYENDMIFAATADTYLKRWVDEAGFHFPARELETFLTDCECFHTSTA